MLALAWTLRYGCRATNPPRGSPIRSCLQSVWQLFRELPELRAISLTGALMYASLSAFWAALAFYLGSDATTRGRAWRGCSAWSARWARSRRTSPAATCSGSGARRIVQLCIVTMLLAWGVFALFGATWAGLVAGVMLLDLGAQAATVSNQTELYRIHPEAQTRLNTIYKVLYFVGGACGSALSAIAWDAVGWRGVCGVGAGFLVLAYAWERSRAQLSRA